jgi:hypothetical protein
VTKLVRNPEVVKACLFESGNKLFTKQDCVIEIPTRFLDRNLAKIGDEIYTVGIYALILPDGNYSVCLMDSFVTIAPTRITTRVVKDVEYTRFHFDAGAAVIDNLTVVKRDLIIFDIIDEIFFKGNNPWYLTYDDRAKLFDTSKQYANSNVGKQLATIELLNALTARSPQDLKTLIRHALVNGGTKSPAFVPLMSVLYTADSTLAKLAGNYFNDGVVSALVNKTDEASRIEQLLRA